MDVGSEAMGPWWRVVSEHCRNVGNGQVPRVWPIVNVASISMNTLCDVQTKNSSGGRAPTPHHFSPPFSSPPPGYFFNISIIIIIIFLIYLASWYGRWHSSRFGPLHVIAWVNLKEITYIQNVIIKIVKGNIWIFKSVRVKKKLCIKY